MALLKLAEPPPASEPRAPVSAPPRFLDPILALAERIDRARMHLRPIRENGLMHLQLTRYRGPNVQLRDGTRVRRGDLVAVLHVDNRALHAMNVGSGWQLKALRLGRQDLSTFADWMAHQPPARRPVALYAYSILAPFALRVGFEAHEVQMTRWRRVVNWYLRGVMARWATGGRRRLVRGRGDLLAHEVWMSAAELTRRYGTTAVG